MKKENKTARLFIFVKPSVKKALFKISEKNKTTVNSIVNELLENLTEKQK